jgi:hypothetical protein
MLLAACGGVARNANDVVVVIGVPFKEVATTQHANYDGGAEIIVGSTNAAHDEIARRVDIGTTNSTVVLLGIFQGQQRTGGYAVRLMRIERRGDQVAVHAEFTAPAAGGIVTQVITSPGHVVSVAAGDVAGAKTAVLLDMSGTERARTPIP